MRRKNRQPLYYCLPSHWYYTVLRIIKMLFNHGRCNSIYQLLHCARLWNRTALGGLLSPPLPTAAVTLDNLFLKCVVLYLNNTCVVHSHCSQRTAVTECDCFTTLLVSHLPLELTWDKVKNNELPPYTLKKFMAS